MSGDDLRWAQVPASELNLALTLTSGQAFRWVQADGDWWGTTGDLVLRFRPSGEGFWWQTYPRPGDWAAVSHYLSLDVDLGRLQRGWVAADPSLEVLFDEVPGLRVLRQEPTEALVAFMCASCNTVSKITRSITAIAERCGGRPMGACAPVACFPAADVVAGLSEEWLRANLWGYRAPHLLNFVAWLASDGVLAQLIHAPYREAHRLLTERRGVGAKLADCMCLFGLGHNDAVPVDTHVRREVVARYRPDLVGRSLTPAVYEALASEMQQRFGSYAGWLQQYLFIHSQRRLGQSSGQRSSREG